MPEVAYTGPQGLAKARTYHPDVALCDIGLPGMDGYDVARAIRADEALQSTFLVAVTGYYVLRSIARQIANHLCDMCLVVLPAGTGRLDCSTMNDRLLRDER
jgi:CheY-like chemotaxis protein